jgi:acetyl-CoA carboxylase carboxyl transferase subunit beta
MVWVRRTTLQPYPAKISRVRAEGLWVKCDGCRRVVWKKDLESNWNVCPECGYHFRINACTRLRLLLDDESYREHDAVIETTDPLNFVDVRPYRERLQAAQQATGMKDAIVTAEGEMGGLPLILCAMEYGFIGGTMGGVVGEKITRAIERAQAAGLPLVIVAASGGARTMEGTVSLMQLAKISAALSRLDEAGLPFISVLTDPTTGGATASFAMLGDLNIAEPGALIGFAGPRVIEQTMRQKLPSGFQRSEFLLERGMLDAVVPRPYLKEFLIRSLRFLAAPEGIETIAVPKHGRWFS